MIYLTLLSTTCVKIHQIPYAIFETMSHFSRHNSFAFFSSKITYFQPIKVQIGRLSTAPVKIHKIPWVIFQIKVSISSKSRPFSVSWEIILLYFFSWNFICYWQKQHIKVQISDVPVLASKSTKLLMPFLESRVSFASNFVSLFIVMRNNSYVLFHLKFFIFWIKGAHQSTSFKTFDCSLEI